MIRYILFLFFLFFTTCNAGLITKKFEMVHGAYAYTYYANLYKSNYPYMYRNSRGNNLYYPAYKFEVTGILRDIRAIKFHLYSRVWYGASSAEVVILKKCGSHSRYSYNPASAECTDELLTDIGTTSLYGSLKGRNMVSSAGNSPAVGLLSKGTGWISATLTKFSEPIWVQRREDYHDGSSEMITYFHSCPTGEFNGTSDTDYTGTCINWSDESIAWGYPDFKIVFSLRTSKPEYLYGYGQTNGNLKPYIEVTYMQADSCFDSTFKTSNYKFTGDLMLVGQSRTIECAENYELVDPSDNFVTCMGDDTFDRTNMCRLMTCPVPATPFNSESVAIFDDFEEPTDRFHHLGYYKYTCEQGYRSTVTNPTNSKGIRTGVIQCISGKWYQNGTNPEISPRRYAHAKDGTVIPYCASISKTTPFIVPIGFWRFLQFRRSSFGYSNLGSEESWYYGQSTVSGIYKMDVSALRNHLGAKYGSTKFNTRYQYILPAARRIFSSTTYKNNLQIVENSLFLLKDYGTSTCGYGSSKPRCLEHFTAGTSINEDNPNGIRKVLQIEDNQKLVFYSSRSAHGVHRSFMNSQIDAPFPTTMNISYSANGAYEAMERASVANNPVDSVAIYDCMLDSDCTAMYFGDYWRDHYYDLAGEISTGYASTATRWDGTNEGVIGQHNPFFRFKSRYYFYGFYFIRNTYGGDAMAYYPANSNTPSIEIDGYDEVTGIKGIGKHAQLVIHTDTLCNNAWTINVTGTDSSWCRENLLIGRSCVPECPTGLKSNNLITCTDPKTFSVTVPEGIHCVPDTCPDSPTPGDIPNGKVNDCIALQEDGTCNPLCNEGFEASGEITCPGGSTINTFQCTPPCGNDVPTTFNHGGDTVDGTTRLVGILGNKLHQDVFAMSNSNECLFIKEGETCKPTCNSGYILEGEMTCSEEKVFTNTAVCRSVCYIDRLVPNATNNDCQTKLLNPGEYCIVRTKGGYSFPDNTKMANITCDANGDIIYPPDPKKDCDWNPVPFGDVGHCLPNVKDTILNVQGACKPGQIVKDAETCVHMYKMIDKHDLKSNWSFALGDNKQLDDKGNYILDTEADYPLYEDRFYADTSPLGCGLGALDVKTTTTTFYRRYSHGYFGRVYRDITKIGTAGNNPYAQWYNLGSFGLQKDSFYTFAELIQATYDMLRTDIEGTLSDEQFTLPGGFYETNDPWEQYEFIKTFMHWYLSSDDVPAGHRLHRGVGTFKQDIVKPGWAQDDCDMIRARDYGYPLQGNYYHNYWKAPYYFPYVYQMIRYGLDGPRYWFDRDGTNNGAGSNGKCHGIGNTGRSRTGAINLVSILGQGGGHWNSFNTDNTYKYPSICNPPMQKNWGESCTPICDPGYELIGTPQTCSADGTMSAVPECKPIACINQPSDTNWKNSFQNGDVSHCDAVAREFNNEKPNGCTPVCDTGYEAFGSFGCESKHEDLQEDLVCELKCPGLVDALANFDDNGGNVSHCADMKHEDKCEATCSIDGEVPIGDIYCLPRFGCSDTCATAKDGTCDDGGNGASFGTCDLGTDCTDCGPRSPNNVVDTARCEKEFTLSDRDASYPGFNKTAPGTCSRIRIQVWDTFGDGWDGGTMTFKDQNGNVLINDAGDSMNGYSHSTDHKKEKVAFYFTDTTTTSINATISCGEWCGELMAEIECMSPESRVEYGGHSKYISDANGCSGTNGCIFSFTTFVATGCEGVKITKSSTCSPTCVNPDFPLLGNPYKVVEENGVETLINAECNGPCVVSDGMLLPYAGNGNCSIGKLQEGESCVPSCETGYIATGSIKCDNDTTVNTVQCNPGPCSTQPTSLPNRASIDSVYIEVDSSVEVPCQLGFTSVGMYSCKDNVLSGNPKCIRQCMHFAENDGEENFILDRGSSRAIQCGEGYTSVGVVKC